VFAQRDANAALPTQQCARRCGDTSKALWGAGGANAPVVSALPTGQCTSSDSACQMLAVRLVCGETDRGIAFQFACECSDGQWSCAGNYFGGGGGALPPCTDAGVNPPDGGQ